MPTHCGATSRFASANAAKLPGFFLSQVATPPRRRPHRPEFLTPPPGSCPIAARSSSSPDAFLLLTGEEGARRVARAWVSGASEGGEKSRGRGRRSAARVGPPSSTPPPTQLPPRHVSTSPRLGLRIPSSRG
ncbi:hypothetical protein BRADI_1g57173v3 [Brachypodium distachyon]|uniref:Uncharacterized protein n=1 Tax=Brachypodium distachyon TaxID=15368 RepID=A0A0Q3HDH7_BRADI|nr:hypothetical protein BRADI_1g57173v3 [Brachypodium distachyon]